MRVMILGDSPFLQTGFGKVNQVAARQLQSEGHEVASVAGLTTEAGPDEISGVQMWYPQRPGDILGVREIPAAMESFNPDIVYSTADPGTASLLAMGIPDMPAFFDTPIEGETIANMHWQSLLKQVPAATTSEYGANVVQKELGIDIPWYYDGIVHDIFNVTGLREPIRDALGWSDKFIITMVTTNVKRKQITRLVEAFSKLYHKQKQHDMVLYLHTVPFQNYWLEGWNLNEIAEMFNVRKQVFFHPSMQKRNDFAPIRTDNPAEPGLVEMYNASDLFVLPSQVEGFGLPIAEAMACGVPVMVTRYAAGWEVASPAGKGIPIRDWEIHKSGTRYANVDPDLLAKEILRLKRNPKERARMRERGLERVKDFTWDAFQSNLTKNLENSIDAHARRRATEKEENQGDSGEAQEEERIRKDALEEGAA